jgi:LysR family transcriptional regulator, hypochlorite-specific transcription factor HypT
VNILWFEDLVALAANGGFSRAAAARHVTQPAFSRRIRALEQWLGVELVDRTRQPIVLTESGRWFTEVAKQTLARLGRLPDEARAIAEASAATIRFAATHALSLTFLPAWLRGFEDGLSGAPIELISDVLARCEDALFEGRVPFVLCHAHPDVRGRLDARCIAKTIGYERLLPVVSAKAAAGFHGKHPSSVPVLAFSTESGLGRIVATLRGNAIAAAGGTTMFTAHLATVLRSMALDGRGVAWLPERLVGDDLRAGRLFAGAPKSWIIPVEIRLYRPAVAQHPSIEAFWAAIRDDGSDTPDYKLATRRGRHGVPADR